MPTKKHKAGEDCLGREFTIIREFAAPRELVFAACTEARHLAQWWGPRGFTAPVCEWDAKPGNKIYVVMRAPDGTRYPMGGEFREVVPPERLVTVTGALDEQGEFRFEIRHEMTFVERDGKTKLTMHSRVIRATPGAGRYIGGFEAGMTQSLERLGELLTQSAGREIVITREFQAPRELVWEAMTNPRHVVNWWGPRGFSTTIETMDFRVGGEWKHVMRGPDGAKYPNHSVFKEIVKPERVVYMHGGQREGGPGVRFESTWSFDALTADKTRVTIRMVFPTAGERDFVVKEFGAVEGGKQTLMKMGEYVAQMLCKPFVIAREFAAPRELVWKAWTERDRLRQWFGPKGVTLKTANLDFRPGGMFHYGMQMPDGKEIWGRFDYLEINPPSRILFVNSFSDKDGGVTRHPFSAQWPLQMLSESTFTERAGKTTVTLKWLPFEATEEERQAFEAARPGMTQGWGGTFEQLAEYLAKG